MRNLLAVLFPAVQLGGQLFFSFPYYTFEGTIMDKFAKVVGYIVIGVVLIRTVDIIVDRAMSPKRKD
jgi:hypothetical protein